MALVIYTDGSCNPNPGAGGWAYVIPSLGIEKSGAEPDTTNNRMELRAVIEALKASEGEPIVKIFSDSRLAINTISGTWKGKKNLDLIEEGRKLCEGRKVFLRWVKAHNGNPHNERCDKLAGIACRAKNDTPTK